MELKVKVDGVEMSIEEAISVQHLDKWSGGFITIENVSI